MVSICARSVDISAVSAPSYRIGKLASKRLRTIWSVGLYGFKPVVTFGGSISAIPVSSPPLTRRTLVIFIAILIFTTERTRC